LTPEDISLATLVFLSAPVKPGAVHRLQPGWGYEVRLAEAAVYGEAVAEAYRRGRQLWRGERDARSMGLGGLIKAYAIRAFEKTGERPLVGLLSSLVVSSALIGYSEAAREKPSAALSRFIQYSLYRAPPSEAVSLIDALEAVGAGEYVSYLDSRGVTRRSVELNATPIGDVFEVLGGVDSGFWLNLRGYSSVLEAARESRGAGSLAEASIRAFRKVASLMGFKVEGSSLRELLKLDAELRRRGASFEGAMGGALAAVLIHYAENPGTRLVPAAGGGGG